MVFHLNLNAMRRYLGIILLLFNALGRGYGKGENNGCSSVKLAYGANGWNKHDVPNRMIPGDSLKVCVQGLACCTPQMEAKLQLQSRNEFDKIMAEKFDVLRTTFISRTAKFDAFFSELLENSKRDLHDMFVRTYGLLYQQNAHVFTNLFDDLRRYYKGSDLNLLDALDDFFSSLMQRMFQLMNQQYTFDEDYIQCVVEHMDELKPFGDVPQKLSIQVKRAFVAARTFMQGLAIGRDVILAMSKIQPTDSCQGAMMKMQFCPYCRGLPHVPPCNNYCMNVMKGCLSYHAELNHQWNLYIEELMRVADRLEGPFNIEAVVDPIDVKISDAIMNFQENAQTVTDKVFTGCGRPNLGRKKREASGEEENWQYDRKNQYVRPTTAAGTSLDRLVRDIREKVQITKDFWKSIPHVICNDVAAPLEEIHHCWNGMGKSRYLPEAIADGIAAQATNPEVDVDIRRPNSVLNQQILQLKLITNKLKNAYNGMDVDWIDSADINSESGSGSADGEGSGSGYNIADDGMSFSEPTRWPAVIQTRRPPKSGVPVDYYNNPPLGNANSAPLRFHWPLLGLFSSSILLCQHFLA